MHQSFKEMQSCWQESWKTCSMFMESCWKQQTCQTMLFIQNNIYFEMRRAIASCELHMNYSNDLTVATKSCLFIEQCWNCIIIKKKKQSVLISYTYSSYLLTLRITTVIIFYVSIQRTSSPSRNLVETSIPENINYVYYLHREFSFDE